eukprot:1157473-Pelagomonas_calceolata.AAC.1
MQSQLSITGLMLPLLLSAAPEAKACQHMLLLLPAAPVRRGKADASTVFSPSTLAAPFSGLARGLGIWSKMLKRAS